MVKTFSIKAPLASLKQRNYLGKFLRELIGDIRALNELCLDNML
jgi:hypothetical protein